MTTSVVECTVTIAISIVLEGEVGVKATSDNEAMAFSELLILECLHKLIFNTKEIGTHVYVVI